VQNLPPKQPLLCEKNIVGFLELNNVYEQLITAMVFFTLRHLLSVL